jgi:hypothetical protein
MSGVVLIVYWGTSSRELRYQLNRVAIIDGVRVGLGKWWTLAYNVPELYTTVLLTYIYRSN